jgi:alkylhydroperoxidase/carboxymuconolactone decarboxylase family protein YurZ
MEKVTDEQYTVSKEFIMNNKMTAFLAVVFASMFLFAASSEAQAVNTQALSPKQESIVTISSFTANGDLEKRNTSLNEGLDAGLTVNEIKEILVQLSAYTGFPRSLNGINTFMAVMGERRKKGIKDEMGKEASSTQDNGFRMSSRCACCSFLPPGRPRRLRPPVFRGRPIGSRRGQTCGAPLAAFSHAYRIVCAKDEA